MERIRSEFRLAIRLPGDAGVAELRRCDDHFFRKARALSMPIHFSRLYIYLMSARTLGLPEIYAALCTLTGPSGDLYDDWKGAFAFPFKLTVRRGDRQLRYLLKLTSYRSMVEPDLYRLIQPGEHYSRDVYHEPFDDELGAGSIIHLLQFVHGYLEGYLETMPEWTTPFVKEIRSNLILFGYDPRASGFLEEEYEEEKKYTAALKRWRALIPEKTAEERAVELEW